MVALAILMGVVASVWSGCRPAGAVAVAPVSIAPMGDRPTYQPPTSGPVLDPFRPPPEPWLPGNRGIEYGTVPGGPATAIGPGRVRFAGPVAGRLVVTVVHPDGLRSSYTGLLAILVTEGDLIDGGQPVGRTADRLHLGVRRGDRYLDPASLWGRPVGGGRAVLVPLDGGSGEGPGRTSTPSSARSGTWRALGDAVRARIRALDPAQPHVTLGARGRPRYTRQPAHRPVRRPTTRLPGPFQRSLPTGALGARSPKPLGRSGP